MEFVACAAEGAVLCARPEGEGMGSSICVISTSPMPDHERSGELYYPSPVVGFGVELRLIHHRARKEGSVHDRERVE